MATVVTTRKRQFSPRVRLVPWGDSASLGAAGKPIDPLAGPSAGDVVAGQPFDITLGIVNQADGTVNADYRGTVRFATDDQSQDPNYPVIVPQPYRYTAEDAGVHTFTGLTFRTVSGTGNLRTLTVIGDDVQTATYSFHVWFRVLATREGLVGQKTACGHVIQRNDHFVALPAHGLCGVGVVVARGSQWLAQRVQDVGPWFGSNNRCDDPYWNTRGRPKTEIKGVGNLAGIDLADGTFSDLGLRDNAKIYWRFS